MQDYTGARIIDIRRGNGSRRNFIYATLVDKDGNWLINATLAYIVSAISKRLPESELPEVAPAYDIDLPHQEP